MKTHLSSAWTLGALHACSIALIVTLAGCAHAPPAQQMGKFRLVSSADLAPGVTGPVALRTIAPKYPERLICAGVAGSTWVHCWIDRTGEPHDVMALDATLPEFAEAAVVAVRKWSFAPARRDGRPLGMWVAIPFEFTPVYPKSTVFRW